MPEFRPTPEQFQRAQQLTAAAAAGKMATVASGYKPSLAHMLADEMLAGTQQSFMLVGGARSGKTFTMVKCIASRAIKAQGARQAILRLHLKDVKEAVGLDTLPKVMRLRYPEIRYSYSSGAGLFRILDKTIPKKDGSEIWLLGLDDQDRTDKILGKEYCGLYYNECNQVSYGSVLTGISRLAQKVVYSTDDGVTHVLRNRVYYDLNPVGTGHFSYSLFIEGRTPGQMESLRNPTDYVYLYLNPGDNAANIADGYIQMLMDYPELKRRRFFEGRYVAQLDGALWTLEMIDNLRLRPGEPLIPSFQRIVVAVDPSGCSGENDLRADEIGMLVAGLGSDGHVYILQDLTGLYSPEGWGRAAVVAYGAWNADRIVAEKNFGGDMVRAVIQGVRIDDKAVGQNVPVRLVNASHGKHVRAEPIAAMYERGMVHHVGDLPQLEKEQINFTTNGYKGAGSPNRADALVWGATELFGNNLSYGLTAYLIEKQAEIDAERDAGVNKTAQHFRNVGAGIGLTQVDVVPEEGKNPTAGCPLCGALCIAPVSSGGKRCGQCGHQFG